MRNRINNFTQSSIVEGLGDVTGINCAHGIVRTVLLVTFNCTLHGDTTVEHNQKKMGRTSAPSIHQVSGRRSRCQCRSVPTWKRILHGAHDRYIRLRRDNLFATQAIWLSSALVSSLWGTLWGREKVKFSNAFCIPTKNIHTACSFHHHRSRRCTEEWRIGWVGMLLEDNQHKPLYNNKLLPHTRIWHQPTSNPMTQTSYRVTAGDWTKRNLKEKRDSF